MIPAGALIREGEQTYVQVAGEAENRSVTVSEVSSLGQVEIVSGLRDGDVIFLPP